MPVLGLQEEAVRKGLEDVLKSPGFARNDRLSRFLRFIIDRHLEGRYEELKESVIGVEVFGRKPDYDTKLDPVVRTEARRLRVRLSEYYAGRGADNPVIIDLPKGGYVPAIRFATHDAPAALPAPETTSARASNWHVPLWAIAGGAIILAAAGWIAFAPAGRTELAKSPAYEVYSPARAAEMQRSVSGAELSIDLFEQAIGKDKTLAPAYAGVAAMEAVRSAFDRFTRAERDEMIAKGWNFAATAMRLDSRSPDAFDAVAMMQARDAQWGRAEYNFRRAIELAPSDPLWRVHFAMFLLQPLGRVDESIAELRTAEALDPHSRQAHYGLMVAFRAAGRSADAESHCLLAGEKDQHKSECWAEALFRQGKTDEAVRALESSWANRLHVMGAQSLGVAYARAGRRADAERVAAAVPHPTSKALIFAALGDKDRTLATLEQVVPMGPTRFGRELLSPEYAFLRGDPRLKVLRKRVGLPD